MKWFFLKLNIQDLDFDDKKPVLRSEAQRFLFDKLIGLTINGSFIFLVRDLVDIKFLFFVRIRIDLNSLFISSNLDVRSWAVCS